jgi:hypothetical protein
MSGPSGPDLGRDVRVALLGEALTGVFHWAGERWIDE